MKTGKNRKKQFAAYVFFYAKAASFCYACRLDNRGKDAEGIDCNVLYCLIKKRDRKAADKIDAVCNFCNAA